MESLARNTVRAAAGRSVAFWALDRRSNYLEDTTGIRAALAAEDFSVAADYYFDGAPVDGRAFGGIDPGAVRTSWDTTSDSSDGDV